MVKATIWHNPRCSKSRETLALLEAQGVDLEIVNYLDTPPSLSQLQQVLTQLNMTANQLVRTKEAEYQQQGLAQAEDLSLLAAMIATPKLIERPVVICGDKAALGRPPEAVLAILS